MTYKPIDHTFTEKGFTYQQLARTGDVAMYRQSKGRVEKFEVVIIQRHDGRVLPNGKTAEPTEYYPCTSQWGSKGFTCDSLFSARAKFDDLVTQEAKKRKEIIPF